MKTNLPDPDNSTPAQVADLSTAQEVWRAGAAPGERQAAPASISRNPKDTRASRVVRCTRTQRWIELRDEGASALAGEVIVQAINDVRLGLHNGWLRPDGSWPREFSKIGKPHTKRAWLQHSVRTAALFLKDVETLSWWLGLAGSDFEAQAFVRMVWTKLRSEVTHAA